MSMEVIVRPYKQHIDDPYIYATWTKFAYYSPQEPIQIPKKEFFQIVASYIATVLKEGDVKVACLKDDRTHVFGYIAVYKGKMEKLCVKKDYRAEGVDQLLVSSMKGKIDEERHTG